MSSWSTYQYFAKYDLAIKSRYTTALKPAPQRDIRTDIGKDNDETLAGGRHNAKERDVLLNYGSYHHILKILSRQLVRDIFQL